MTLHLSGNLFYFVSIWGSWAWFKGQHWIEKLIFWFFTCCWWWCWWWSCGWYPLDYWIK